MLECLNCVVMDSEIIHNWLLRQGVSLKSYRNELASGSGRIRHNDLQFDFPWGVGELMLFFVFYILAIVILIGHFTGWLARHNLEWIVIVLAVLIFPAVILL